MRSMEFVDSHPFAQNTKGWGTERAYAAAPNSIRPYRAENFSKTHSQGCASLALGYYHYIPPGCEFMIS